MSEISYSLQCALTCVAAGQYRVALDILQEARLASAADTVRCRAIRTHIVTAEQAIMPEVLREALR
jgi:hypothetical protein